MMWLTMSDWKSQTGGSKRSQRLLEEINLVHEIRILIVEFRAIVFQIRQEVQVIETLGLPEVKYLIFAAKHLSQTPLLTILCHRYCWSLHHRGKGRYHVSTQEAINLFQDF